MTEQTTDAGLTLLGEGLFPWWVLLLWGILAIVLGFMFLSSPGITTELLGQDGIAAAPMAPKHTAEWRQYLAGLSGDPAISWDWKSLGQYAKRLAASP